jgi:hypothetical protein
MFGELGQFRDRQGGCHGSACAGGTTNETLEALPDAAIRRALLALAYPDRPALRAEFRSRQQLGDDGAEPPPEALETAVNEQAKGRRAGCQPLGQLFPESDAARPRQARGWVMLTIQGMPNRSTHMPNSSPHICFSSGTDTVPPSDSFSQ